MRAALSAYAANEYGGEQDNNIHYIEKYRLNTKSGRKNDSTLIIVS